MAPRSRRCESVVCGASQQLASDCVSSKRIANENDAEIEHWLKNVNEHECKHVNAIVVNSLASLRDWERRDSLRRLLENKSGAGEHEEL
ncbi:hypothetical protein TELCIR_04504 [Teladorsagia circumcincta]|uniref:Uncharacterized protein n=1 Tax=Teladorsagia circumcincta TaxID=45464 RepID=A0A2G9UTM4_TELCI|nr:hypothetical protein TELCIR_04504 [Teladorsagia circumcincta]